MRYVGGKGRIARPIVKAIRTLSPDARLAVEPFMGGASVTAALAQEFDVVLASDAHPDVAALWSAVVDGWEPPDTITEREYAELRDAPPSALRGLAGFGGSFGGKWFGGYARGGIMASTREPRDHQAESVRAVRRIARDLSQAAVYVRTADYQSSPVIPGSVIYCDPPYAGTQGYATGGFDTVDFWVWAELASEVADVYVSEYRAPAWWSCIWSAEKRQSVTLPSQGREMRTEKLFTLKA